MVNFKVAANFVLCMKIVCLWESSIIKLLAHTSPTFFKSQPNENFFRIQKYYLDFKSGILELFGRRPTSLAWIDDKNFKKSESEEMNNIGGRWQKARKREIWGIFEILNMCVREGVNNRTANREKPEPTQTEKVWRAAPQPPWRAFFYSDGQPRRGKKNRKVTTNKD